MPVKPEDFELKTGYYRFGAIFTSEPGQDRAAIEKVQSLMGGLPLGIYGGGFYLIGARTVIFIGQTDSAAHLLSFISSVTYDSPIEAQVYHAVELHELPPLVKSQAKS